MNDTPPAQNPGLPWELRADLGAFPALLDTVKGVLLEPASTFERMRGDGIGGALLYAVILGTFGGIVALVWQVAFSAALPLLESGLQQGFTETLVSSAVFALLMPVIVVVQQFVLAGVVHLCALVFGAGERGFDVTFQVLAYSLGSTAVLNLVPAFGGLAAFVWSLVAAIVGLSRAHGTTGGRAAAAVLLPLGICCLVTLGSVLLLVSFVLSS